MKSALSFKEAPVYGSGEARLCRLPMCRERFSPVKPNQEFCSPGHKAEFWRLVRKMGLAAVEAMEKETRL